jgi:hypothetical protein
VLSVLKDVPLRAGVAFESKEKSCKALCFSLISFAVKDILSAVKSIVYGLGKLAVLNRHMFSIKKVISYLCNRAFEQHRQHALFQFPGFQDR